MADIDKLLREASENIEIQYIDSEDVLSKAKIKKPKVSIWKKTKLGYALGGLGLAMGCAALVAVPAILLNSNDSPINGGVNSGLNNMGDNRTDDDHKIDDSGKGGGDDPVIPGPDDDFSFSHEPEFNGNISTQTIKQTFDIEELETGSLKALKKRAETSAFTMEQSTEGFKSFVKKVNKFANPLFENINKKQTEKSNTAYSPTTIYFALSMLSNVISGQDKQNVLNILGVTESELETYIPTLFQACNNTYLNKENEYIAKERIDNSIWLDDKFVFNEDIINELGETYFTNVFAGDFLLDNVTMNEQITEYVKECTEGILQEDFAFKKETAFAIINSLYFEDVWNDLNVSLASAGTKTFKQFGGTTKNVEFFESEDTPGMIRETNKYKSMYIGTPNGFKIEFIVPNDGVSVDDLYKSDVMNQHEDTDYLYNTRYTQYYAKIVFPEFSASFSSNILEDIYSTYDIPKIVNFGDFAYDKFIGDDEFEISSIKHVTQVDVTKDKLVGASTTASECSTGSTIVRNVKQTLVVDRPFIYTIKDSSNIMLFNGVVYNI